MANASVTKARQMAHLVSIAIVSSVNASVTSARQMAHSSVASRRGNLSKWRGGQIWLGLGGGVGPGLGLGLGLGLELG